MDNFLDQLWDVAKSAAPTVLGGIAGTLTANPIIGGLVGKAVSGVLGKTVTGGLPTEAEAAQIMQDPKLYAQFKMQMGQIEVQKLQEETKQLQAVNQTMQTEAVSGSKAQRGWRPFNGFAFGITLFCDYVLAQTILALSSSQMVWSHIPLEIYMLWTGLLGITAGSRGVEKIAKLRGPGLLGVIKSAIK